MRVQGTVREAFPHHTHYLSMESSLPTDPSVGIPPTKRRPGRIKKKRRMSSSTMYAMIFAILLVVAVVAQLVYHAVRTDPRDTRMIAERELELNTLRPGERVVHAVSVFKRPAIDYFRATRGLLVLTNERLLYLGLEPRDLLAAPDLPPTFEEQVFPIDTLVHVSAGRTFFGFAKAVVIQTPTEKLKLGVPSSTWSKADVMIVAMNVRHDRAVAHSAEERQFLARAEAQRKAVEADRRKPRFYTVRRGDALGSIATIWNTTPDKLRGWNKLPDNKIRVGQVLMVRPAL
jgi:LysM repeat protein